MHRCLCCCATQLCAGMRGVSHTSGLAADILSWRFHCHCPLPPCNHLPRTLLVIHTDTHLQIHKDLSTQTHTLINGPFRTLISTQKTRRMSSHVMLSKTTPPVSENKVTRKCQSVLSFHRCLSLLVWCGIVTRLKYPREHPLTSEGA